MAKPAVARRLVPHPSIRDVGVVDEKLLIV
jgi:hypothetical protein